MVPSGEKGGRKFDDRKIMETEICGLGTRGRKQIQEEDE